MRQPGNIKARERTTLLPKCHSADEILAAKLRLVSNAIDQIGFTAYHAKLFCLSGFGYAADSLMGFLISIAADQVVAEYRPSWTRGGQIALYAGLLLGSFCWGLGADVLGRRGAFHVSLFVCAFFGMLAGIAPSYAVWTLCVALSGFGEGGNIALDATVFLEFLPSHKRWLVTTLACWWGVGQTVAGLLAWPLLGTKGMSCPLDGSECLRVDNMGWRYLYLAAGGMVLLMAMARGFFIHLHETPQYLLSRGQDEEVASFLTDLAAAHSRPCSLTLVDIKACGALAVTEIEGRPKSRWFDELSIHTTGLFSSRRMSFSVIMLWLAWGLIGLAYPLFYMFLPEYLATRASQGEEGVNVWMGFAITNMCAIPGPVVAGWLCEIRLVGRKGTMFIGAMATMLSFIGYTTVTTPSQSLFWSCAISLCINVYYATLYAYTPEVLPSKHRATGYGTALAINRFMGIVAALIVTRVSTATATPLFICAGLLAVAGAVSLSFPIETRDVEVD